MHKQLEDLPLTRTKQIAAAKIIRDISAMTGVEITAKLAWSQRCDHCEGLITTEKWQQCIMGRGEEGEEGAKTVSIMSHSFPPGINTR